MKPPSAQALRQLAMTQQRARAASAKAFALAALATLYGQKLADARRSQRGAALHAMIAALMREPAAAERTLRARLAAEAGAERLAIAQRFRAPQRPAGHARQPSRVGLAA